VGNDVHDNMCLMHSESQRILSFSPLTVRSLFHKSPQHPILLILFSNGLHSGHFYTILTSNMTDLKQKIEQAREKYCATTIFHYHIHLLECKASQNLVVFCWEVHFGDEKKDMF